MSETAAFSVLDEALWRMQMVKDRTHMSESQILRLEQDGDFPPRRRIGDRSVAWLASEVIQWMRNRPLAQDVAASNAPPRSRGRPRKQSA